MNVQSTIKESGTGTTCPVFLDGFDRSFLDLGMIGQSEIAVRTQHQHLLSVADHFGILLGAYFTKIGVVSQSHSFAGILKLMTLIDDTHLRYPCLSD